jgi:peptidyl-prolyl cis-trans isomerase A (cyclophilin A)
MPNVGSDKSLMGVWPTFRGNPLVGGYYDNGSILAEVEPTTGRVTMNGYSYAVLPFSIYLRPEYVPSSGQYLIDSSSGSIVMSEQLVRHTILNVPNGIGPTAYVGNIVNNVGSTQGNYFAQVTSNGTLWVQSMTGIWTPPPLPSLDPEDPTAIIVTDKGNITVGFFRDTSPATVEHFIALAEGGAYDGTLFDPVVPYESISTDPGVETGNSIPTEGSAVAIYHNRTVVSMAAKGSECGPGFAISLSGWSTLGMEGRYAVFGKVIDGMDVVEAINQVPVDDQWHPETDVSIQRVVIVWPPDTEPPVALAGPDVNVSLSEMDGLVMLNGSASTDNVGVVNWTWSFEMNGEEHFLYGPEHEIKFDWGPTHDVNLTVRDAAGNVDSDTLLVQVVDYKDPPRPPEPWYDTHASAIILTLVGLIVLIIALVFMARRQVGSA